MSIEFFESANEGAETKLSAFQNDIFVNNPLHEDLSPKIRFTTDIHEAEKAAEERANHSSPFDIPDSVIYVKPLNDMSENDDNDVTPDFSDTQSDNSVDSAARSFEQTSSEETSSKDYFGPDSEALSIKISEAEKHLDFAKEQLEKAIESGGNVMSAMSLVESSQKLLDSYVIQYNKALMAEEQAAAYDTVSPKAENIKLGSVSHAEHELEKAYESGNSIRIDNAKRDLAREKAKEDSKNMR